MKRISFTKVKNKVFELIRKTVPHNYKYKPTGVYTTSKQYVTAVRGARYKEIFPNLVSHLHIPAGLYEAHDNPKPALTVETNYVVVEIPNGRVHTDNKSSIAVISADNKLIGDVSFSYTDKIVAPEQNNIFRQKYFTKPKVYKGVVFTMLAGGPSIVNYGHWMHDVLPRIYLLKKSGWFNKVDYFLVPSVRYDFQRDSLQLLGIAPEKIIDGEKNPHITAHTIIAATAPRGNDTLVPQWALDFLRQSYLTNISSHLNSPAHIYISRKDSRHRNVLNEETLMKVLGKYSFVSYQLSGLPFIEKVRLFATADVVITHTGAGLTNLIFCRPGTRILEIFSDKMVLGPFFDIAQRLNLDYQYLIARSVPNNKNRPQGLEDDIYVDLQQIQSLMHKIIHVNDEGKVTNRYNNSHRPS